MSGWTAECLCVGGLCHDKGSFKCPCDIIYNLRRWTGQDGLLNGGGLNITHIRLK